ncbi:MAG: ATP-binding cassette domain-containing protein [Flavobacteriaceae bacterium]|nr:ATP-binding cassette domain-containing protein [Flavobacteriaceae bacterium]
MILEIDNVELYLKNKTILNGIYLKAETGKITGILGSNGAGKTSLFEVIFGALKSKYKLVRIDGKPLLKPLYQTGKVKYLPQYHFVPKNFKLKTLFKNYNVNWNNFTSQFPSFTNLENKKFHTFSGGEKRLIEVHAILKSPSEIVFLDEPFTHLAPLIIEIIKTLIQSEKANKVLVISDHIHEHITEISDTIYLLKNGWTKQINDTHELQDYHYIPH